MRLMLLAGLVLAVSACGTATTGHDRAVSGPYLGGSAGGGPPG